MFHNQNQVSLSAYKNNLSASLIGYYDYVDADIVTGGNDFEIFHNGSQNIVGNNTTQLRLITDQLRLRSFTGSETYAQANVNGGFELNYDNTKKFETTSTGAAVINTSSPQTSASSQANDLVVSGSGDMGLTLHSDSSSSDSNIFFSDPDSHRRHNLPKLLSLFLKKLRI